MRKLTERQTEILLAFYLGISIVDILWGWTVDYLDYLEQKGTK